MKLKLWLLFTAVAWYVGCRIRTVVSSPQGIRRYVTRSERRPYAGSPYWGEKNLMIFYIDPDHHKQNEDFTTDMEENHRVEGENLFGFGVMNLKDKLR